MPIQRIDGRKLRQARLDKDWTVSDAFKALWLKFDIRYSEKQILQWEAEETTMNSATEFVFEHLYGKPRGYFRRELLGHNDQSGLSVNA